MIDYEKLNSEIQEQCLKAMKRHNSIIEEKIKQAIIKYNCKPSEIEIEAHPNFHYKLKINASDFCFDDNFKLKVDDD